MLHPSFWLLWVLFRLALIVQMGSALPIAIGARRSSIRALDRQIQPVEIALSEISPRFLRHGRSHHLRTIGGNESFLDGQGESFGRKRLGGGGGGGGGGGEGMFYERAGGPWGMEREIIGL